MIELKKKKTTKKQIYHCLNMGYLYGRAEMGKFFPSVENISLVHCAHS